MAMVTVDGDGSVEVLYHIPGYLIVINKPHGVCMDGEDPVTAAKLCWRALARLEGLSEAAAQNAARHIHQLDFATSGCLCYGLTREASASIGVLFSGRRTRKIYIALVWGHMQADTYVFDSSIAEPPGNAFQQVLGSREMQGRPCVTHGFVAHRGYRGGRAVTSIVLLPRTGRRHQLRVHLAAAGFPIVGDTCYTVDNPEKDRMMLHAWQLGLHFPPPLNSVVVSSVNPFEALLEEAVPSELLKRLNLEGSSDTKGVGLDCIAQLRDFEECQLDFALAGTLPYTVTSV